MATETAAEVFDRLASQLVSVREGEINQQAVGIVAKRREAHQLLENDEALRGLLLEKEAFWNTQELEGELKKARSFPAELRALLERFGVANIPLETGETKPVQVRLQEPKMKVERPLKIPTTVTVDGRVFKTTPTRARLFEELLVRNAREPNSGILAGALAAAVYPDLIDDLPRAKAHLSVIINEIKRFHGEEGLEVVSTRKTRPKEPVRYFLPMLSPLPSRGVLDLSGDGKVPPTDGHQPDNGLDGTENIQGELTFTEEEILILGHALRVTYINYRQSNGRMNRFGIVLTRNTFDDLGSDVVRNGIVNLENPQFNIQKNFPGIIRKMTHGDERLIQAQNDERVAILLRIFTDLRRQSLEVLKKALVDLLGYYRSEVEESLKSKR